MNITITLEQAEAIYNALETDKEHLTGEGVDIAEGIQEMLDKIISEERMIII